MIGATILHGLRLVRAINPSHKAARKEKDAMISIKAKNYLISIKSHPRAILENVNAILTFS